MEDKLESLLVHTVEVALATKAMSLREFDHVNVDTTVQEKAVAFPTDARLYNRMREVLVRESQKRGIALRQSYLHVGKKALIMQGRYSHARQMKRSAKQTRTLKTYLGRVVRDIERKAMDKDEQLVALLAQANRLLIQKRDDSNKLYSIHAPEVECLRRVKCISAMNLGTKPHLPPRQSRTGWSLHKA